jgi:amidohydrolase
MVKDAVRLEVDALAGKLFEINDWMFSNPEVGFQEFGAAQKLAAFLQSSGFEVEKGVAGMETAFVGTWRGGPGPVIGIFAEYDALPGIGHACGHNVIGASAAGAAAALAKAWPDMPGTIRLFGSPAEEGGGGKVLMIEAGLLQGVDAAMMIHASNADRVFCNNLSVQRAEITFHGRTAQPAGSAHEGVSAFEAAILTWTNINAIRQYLRPDFYIHGIMKEGGFAANVIPDRATLVMYVRAPRGRDVDYLYGRVMDCAQAAAMTTGATCEVSQKGRRYLRVVNNPVILELMEANYRSLGLDVKPPLPHPRASTDMGNISQVAPSVHGYIKIGEPDVIGNTHSPGFAPQTVTEAAHQAILNGAKAMAMTAVDLLSRPDRLAEAKCLFEAQMRDELA